MTPDTESASRQRPPMLFRCRALEDRRPVAMPPTTPHEILETRAALRALSPPVRFGQRLANLQLRVEDQTGRSLWDIEDEPLLEVMERHRVALSRRRDDDV